MEASRRNVAMSPDQKKQLLALLMKNPKLLMINHFKPGDTDMLSHRDGRKLWKNIATELNAIKPGVMKTWRNWRKCWQDFKSKAKKQYECSCKIPYSLSMLTEAEMEVIGLKKTTTTNQRECNNKTEFVPIVGEETEIGDNEPTIENCNKDPTTIASFNNDCNMESCDSDSTIESSDNDSTIKTRTYTSSQQKKRLLQLVVKHPKLSSLNSGQPGVTDIRTQIECRKLWKTIATELNSVKPGAKKTWDKWKKCWQDLKSKAKKKQKKHQASCESPYSASMLTPAEMEAIGLKKVMSYESLHPSEFKPAEGVEIETDNIPNIEGSANKKASVGSVSEAESFTDENLLASSEDTLKSKSESLESSSHNSNKTSSSCPFNCEMLAVQERKKVQIQEDYYSFKKDYLKQKLAALKMQAEALKTIAKELSNK